MNPYTGPLSQFKGRFEARIFFLSTTNQMNAFSNNFPRTFRWGPFDVNIYIDVDERKWGPKCGRIHRLKLGQIFQFKCSYFVH